jgi:hypothetical protein
LKVKTAVAHPPCDENGGRAAARVPVPSDCLPAVSDAGSQSVAGGDHGCGSFVDGVDDFGVVDPAQVDRGDRQVGVPELALDDQQRHTFA